jgi:hypothetical protein
MNGRTEKTQKPTARARLLKLINGMSELQCQKFLRHLKARQNSERRQDSRTPCTIPVDYTAGGRVFKDFIQNISAGGLSIETLKAFSPGQEITLTFMPPNGQKPVRLFGKIMRNEPTAIGVRFKDPPKAPVTTNAAPKFPSQARDVGKDRRKGTRLDFHCPVLIQGLEGEYTITDISLHGAFIEYAHTPQSQFTVMQILNLLIRLPTEENPTEVKAIIANVREHGVGCRFAGLTKGAQDAIHRCFNVAKHSIPLS